MSYLHCPTCNRAFNLAAQPTCPYCPVAATLVDPSEDIVAAAEQLARAMARATVSERAAAIGRMDRLALPAPGAAPVGFHGAMLRTIRDALHPPPPARPQPLLTTIALAVFARLETRPRLQAGLRRAAGAIHARVKALAA